MTIDDAGRELYELLRDGDGQGPPKEVFDLFRSAIGDRTMDAVYSECAESDGGASWTVWAVVGSAILRISAPVRLRNSGYELSGWPIAVLFPLQVRKLSPTIWSGSTVWQAELVGPDGETLSVDLPAEELRRDRHQQEQAELFAGALRKAMIRAT